MYLAAEGGHIFIVKLLLQHPDIDVNSRSGDREGGLVVRRRQVRAVPFPPPLSREGTFWSCLDLSKIDPLKERQFLTRKKCIGLDPDTLGQCALLNRF